MLNLRDPALAVPIASTVSASTGLSTHLRFSTDGRARGRSAEYDGTFELVAPRRAPGQPDASADTLQSHRRV